MHSNTISDYAIQFYSTGRGSKVKHQSRNFLAIAVAIAVVGRTPQLDAGIPVFEPLGDLPGGGCSIQWVDTISEDGNVIISSCSNIGHTIWTRSQGLNLISELPNWPTNGTPLQLSADGTTILGRDFPNGHFLWSASNGVQPLGITLPTEPILSANGQVVVGSRSTATGRELWRWTMQTGLVGLGDIPGSEPSWSGSVLSVSGDGSTISSYSRSTEVSAHRWTADNGYAEQFILTPSEGNLGVVFDASPDGSVFVGTDNEPVSEISRMYRWSADSGFEYFSGPDAVLNSYPYVSGDGSIVVGMGMSTYRYEPFVWTAADGARWLRDILIDDFGADLTAWDTLGVVKGISADGNTIVGEGFELGGFEKGWVAHIPEPSSIALISVGVITAFRRRRR